MNLLTFQIDASIDLEDGAIRVDMLIDGRVPSSDLLEVSGVLFGGASEHAFFDIYTCSCGISGCAGFHHPIEHRRDDDRVIWIIKDEKLAGLLRAERLEFDIELFDAARRSLLTDLRALEAGGRHAESLMEPDWRVSEGEHRIGLGLDATAARLLPYFHGQAAMERARAAASDPAAPGIIRFSWGAPNVRADGTVLKEDTFDRPSVDAAAALLRLSDSLAPNDAEAAAELGQATAIVRAFALGGDRDQAEQAFRPLRRFLQRDGMDDPEADIFVVDDIGPLVRHP